MRLLKKALLASSFAAPALLSAHPGHDGHDLTWDFSAGALHPLSGWDHVLAMVAVGVWAFQLGGKARWALPAAFVASLSLGAVLGAGSIAPSSSEQLIAASLLVLGLLVATATRIPTWAGAAAVSLFALFHGFAHGTEIPANASGLTYGLGFMAASAVLHVTGLGLATFGTRFPTALRLAGGAVSLAGLAMLA